jgi:hypothetical protein
MVEQAQQVPSEPVTMVHVPAQKIAPTHFRSRSNTFPAPAPRLANTSGRHIPPLNPDEAVTNPPPEMVYGMVSAPTNLASYDTPSGYPYPQHRAPPGNYGAYGQPSSMHGGFPVHHHNYQQVHTHMMPTQAQMFNQSMQAAVDRSQSHSHRGVNLPPSYTNNGYSRYPPQGQNSYGTNTHMYGQGQNSYGSNSPMHGSGVYPPQQTQQPYYSNMGPPRSGYLLDGNGQQRSTSISMGSRMHPYTRPAVPKSGDSNAISGPSQQAGGRSRSNSGSSMVARDMQGMALMSPPDPYNSSSSLDQYASTYGRNTSVDATRRQATSPERSHLKLAHLKLAPISDIHKENENDINMQAAPSVDELPGAQKMTQ